MKGEVYATNYPGDYEPWDNFEKTRKENQALYIDKLAVVLGAADRVSDDCIVLSATKEGEAARKQSWIKQSAANYYMDTLARNINTQLTLAEARERALEEYAIENAFQQSVARSAAYILSALDRDPILPRGDLARLNWAFQTSRFQLADDHPMLKFYYRQLNIMPIDTTSGGYGSYKQQAADYIKSNPDSWDITGLLDA